MPDLASLLDFLKKQKWPDSRTTLFAVQAETGDGSVRLMGQVLEAEQRAEAEQAIRQAAPESKIVNEVAVLSRPDTLWALVRGALSNLRKTPSNGAELTAQALFGEPVELLKRDPDKPDWWFVRASDGYLGWTIDSYLSPCERASALDYRAQADALVLAELTWAYVDPELLATVGRLPFGVPVRVFERYNDLVRINWESEPPLWVAERDLLPRSKRPRPDKEGIAQTLDLMGRFIGVPYLWGGESPFGFDCSGFAQAALEFLGASLPRDADMQCVAGRPIEGDPRPGDLLFFTGKSSTASHAERMGAVSHVALSLGGTEFIHATQVLWGVQLNSLDPASPMYRASLKERLVAVRRFV